jgi:glycine hydroxymethyltransferase
VRYKTLPEEKGRIDFDEVRRLALESRPEIVLCGYTSYPRDYDYAEFKRIADEVGALTMADIAHVGGLGAADVMANPFDAGFDIVTTTTHKTLRGPRGGMVLCRKALAKEIDRSVFPGLQGGPHMNAIAAIAITLKKAQEPEFREYAAQVMSNSRALAAALIDGGATLVTGGTDNHMVVLDTMASFGIDGREAERALDRISITTNKQVIPDDPNPPLRPSGIRLGSPAATTRGMREEEMQRIAGLLLAALRDREDEARLEALRAEVESLCLGFPVPGI